MRLEPSSAPEFLLRHPPIGTGVAFPQLSVQLGLPHTSPTLRAELLLALCAELCPTACLSLEVSYTTLICVAASPLSQPPLTAAALLSTVPSLGDRHSALALGYPRRQPT